MRSSNLFSSFLALGPALALKIAPRTTSVTNFTAPTGVIDSSSAAVPSSCCFFVQDTISEFYWEKYAVIPVLQVYTISYITTFVTPYIDTVITRYQTSLLPSSYWGSGTTTFSINNGQLAVNKAPMPSQTASAIIANGTQIVTAGVTVADPTAFWIYSTVKVITVPAVTDASGNVVCATISNAAMSSEVVYLEYHWSTITSTSGTSEIVSSFNTPWWTTTSSTMTLSLSSINSNAEAYFGGPQLASSATAPNTITGSTIVFPTPYFYAPWWANGSPIFNKNKRQLITPPDPSAFSTEPYGYVPQTVINNLLSSPEYASLSSCLPGGPSIIIPDTSLTLAISKNLPYSWTIAQDLTSSGVTTVYGWESSYAITSTYGQVTSGIGSVSRIVGTATGAATPSQSEAPAPGSTSPSQPLRTETASFLQRPTPTSYPVLPITVSGSSFLPLPPTTIPFIPGVSVPGHTTILADGNTQIIVTASTLLQLPPSTPTPTPAYPFRTTVVSGSTYLELPPTTVPLIPGLSISGETTVLGDGSTNVIVTASTLVPLPSSPPTYPFPTTIISGSTYLEVAPTTVPFVPGVSIPGKTTVLSDGSTVVIVTASTLLPLPPSLPTTIISGTTYLEVGPTTVPVSFMPGVSIAGKTTVLPNGNTEVIVSASTKVAISGTGNSPASTSARSGAASIGAGLRNKGWSWTRTLLFLPLVSILAL